MNRDRTPNKQAIIMVPLFLIALLHHRYYTHHNYEKNMKAFSAYGYTVE